jgi:hypothetical protein
MVDGGWAAAAPDDPATAVMPGAPEGWAQAEPARMNDATASSHTRHAWAGLRNSCEVTETSDRTLSTDDAIDVEG